MSERAAACCCLFMAGFVAIAAGPACAPSAARRAALDVAEQGQTAETPATKPAEPPADKLNWRAYNHYVNGLLFEGMGDLRNAALNYKEALKHFPGSYEIGYAHAVVLYRMGEAKQSLAVLQKLESQTSEVLELSANCYRRLGLMDSVRAAYLSLIEIEPDNTLAYAFLAGYYRQRQDLDSAVWAYEQLARIRPESYRELNDLARLLAQRKDYDRAKEVFRLSIEAESGPANMIAYIGLGELYLVVEQHDSAVIAFQEGLEVQPDNLVLHRELTNVYVQMGSIPVAIRHAREVVKLSPLDRSARRRLGILYFSVDSLSLADSILASLVDSGDLNFYNHYYRGRIAARQDDWERAREEFSREVQLADTLSQGWVDLGMAYRRLGEPEKEIETYQTGLNHMRVEARAIDLLFQLGVAYERDNRAEEATATFEELIAHNPDHAAALNYLGYMLADRGERLDYAKELIERAVALAPENPAYLDSYGWVFFRLGQYDEALTYLKKAAALDIDPVILDHLGDAYQAVGKMDLAREWWEKALEQQPDNEKIKEKLGR